MATYSSFLAWRIPMDREACWATVRGVAKSPTRLSDSHFCFLIIVCQPFSRGECGQSFSKGEYDVDSACRDCFAGVILLNSWDE